MTYGYAEPSGMGIVVVVAALLVHASSRFRDWKTPDTGTVEHAKQLYQDGEIDEAELERRLDVVADPEAERIRNAVERVSGIGEQTSFDLAAEFRSLDELREASVDRLTEVSNIGPERAKALKRQL